MEDKDNEIFSQDHTITAHKAMDATTFPFLHLPVELQFQILNHIKRCSDLKVICLTSKEINDIAKPFLYHSVELKPNATIGSDEKEDEAEGMILRKIKSLLLGPANLLFVRVLATGRFGLESTQLMDKLLPLLREDFLTEFSYATKSTEHFPTPLQLQFLWGRQKNLENLKVYNHLVPSLEEFFRERREAKQGALLKSFARLTVSDFSATNSDEIFDMISWPMRNLDLSHLRELSFHGLNNAKASNIMSSLNTLLAARCFVNLTNLRFKRISFDDTLILTNMPLLERLIIDSCRTHRPSQPLVRACNSPRLLYLVFWGSGSIEEIAPLVTQIKDLESLVMFCDERVQLKMQVQRDLVHAILMHKKTLRVLDLGIIAPIFKASLDALLWDTYFAKDLQGCQNLVDLSLPLLPIRRASYYRDLIEALPSLSDLTIYTAIDFCIIYRSDLASQIFPASTRLTCVTFEDYLHKTYCVVRKQPYFQG